MRQAYKNLDLNGSKPLAFGRTSEIFPIGQDKILKLFSKDWPIRSIEQEAFITDTVSKLGLPAPKVGEIVKIGDRTGLTYERIEGESLTSHLKKRPWLLLQGIRMLAQLQAEIHEHVVPKFPSQRQRLLKRIAAASLPSQTKDRVLSILDQLPDDDKLCHGDFHIDNIIVTTKGPIVVDWDAATKGNPLGDLAQTVLLLRFGAPLPRRVSVLDKLTLNTVRRIIPLGKLYLQQYFQLHPDGENQINRWITVSAAARVSENFLEEQERLQLSEIVDKGL